MRSLRLSVRSLSRRSLRARASRLASSSSRADASSRTVDSASRQRAALTTAMVAWRAKISRTSRVSGSKKASSPE